MQARRLSGSLLSALATAALCPALLSGAPASAALTQATAGQVPATAAGTWGDAQQVPGLAALNKGNDDEVDAISCASAGNCSAGGSYLNKVHGGLFQAFVVDETNGTWGTAREVPGTAALNVGFEAKVISISCASAGNCSAGGFYTDASDDTQPFVVTETNGTWGTAQEVVTKNRSSAQITSVSCAAPGNCSAVGFYRLQTFIVTRVFGVSEKNGVWGTAKTFPGLAAKKGSQRVSSVSCPAVGTCTAGGSFTDSAGGSQAYVVSQTHGRWGAVTAISGLPAQTEILSLSCAKPGNCAAGGDSGGINNPDHAFVVTQTNGTWGTAEQVQGLAALNKEGADIASVSCTSAVDCTAAGSYLDAAVKDHPFIVTETNGTWGTAEQVPGLAALNHGSSELGEVSCATPGDCAITGDYIDASKVIQAFVATKHNGTWGAAQMVQGLAGLAPLGASGTVVSCGAVGNCGAAGGYFGDGNQVFVVNES